MADPARMPEPSGSMPASAPGAPEPTRASAAAPSETVAACLIVMNESERIAGALASVAFCDEVIVVDGGSTDDTREIAMGLGARVEHNPWPGYARQRNHAIDLASSDWILEVDADERVSPQLGREIEEFLATRSRSFDMAVVPLRDHFRGKALGPASNYPKYRCRLFRRGAYRHDERRVVHEGLWPTSATWPLEGDLDHILASSWRESFSDSLHYAKLQSRHLPSPGATTLVAEGAVRPALKFFYRVLAAGGWRDGFAGVAVVGLECATDSLSWIYAARRSEDAEVEQVHTPTRAGAVRIVGLAATDEAAARGADWLAEAGTLGADVSLVAPTSDGSEAVRVRTFGRFGPLRMIRGLEAENQVRPIDAIVTCDTASSVVARLLRPRLRRRVRSSAGRTSPEAVVSEVEATRRAPATMVRAAAR